MKLLAFSKLRTFSHITSFAVMTSIAFISSAHAKRRTRSLADVIQQSVDAITVKAPEDLETCFSPDEPCDIKLTKFIESAKQSIDIAIYDINLDQLVHQILVKSKTIPVRIVVDSRQAKGAHSLVPLLIKAGAQVKFGRQRGIMHDKFTIIDGKILETGSFNYTHHAATANQENQVYLANPKIVVRYKQRFEKIWQTAAPPHKKIQNE